jgi:CheY-like chemotaxis protein
MEGDKENFLFFGFTYYLSKPFTKADLYNVLSEAFKKEK